MCTLKAGENNGYVLIGSQGWVLVLGASDTWLLQEVSGGPRPRNSQISFDKNFKALKSLG